MSSLARVVGRTVWLSQALFAAALRARIMGRSLADGVEGWVSVRGNQGTPFLKEVEKRYYASVVELPLEDAFKAEGEAKVVRALKADEVLELLEGPRKQTFEAGTRVKGKASSDGAVGWFTAKDSTGRRGEVWEVVRRARAMTSRARMGKAVADAPHAVSSSLPRPVGRNSMASAAGGGRHPGSSMCITICSVVWEGGLAILGEGCAVYLLRLSLCGDRRGSTTCMRGC